jgi:CheY-like chemotaxis protein
MAIAALIIVGLLLISTTLVASLLLQRRAELRDARRNREDFDALSSDEYSERLRKSLRSRLSHELRTPLNSIISLSHLMIEDQGRTLSPDQRKYKEVIRRNGRNLLAMVDHIGEGGASASQEAAAGGAAEGVAPTAGAETAPGDETDPAQTPIDDPREPGPVLLIEDDPIERQRIGSFIEAAGYDVTRAASGEEGLALLRSRPFAAVVLDLIMPEMSGLDVLRAARTEDRLADVRFIVLSAMYMTKNERQVLGPRVADVVRKGETMPRALTFALRRAVKPAHPEAHLQPGSGSRHL